MNSDHPREIIEAAPSLPSFSVSEKLALYGSAGLSGMELLVLLVGKKSIATALVRHFGSLKALSHASFRELRQFLPRRQAEAVMAALSVANVAEAEHALSARLNNPEAIYKANLDMKGFHQEVVRVVLLDSQLRCITKVDIAKGTVKRIGCVPSRNPAAANHAFVVRFRTGAQPPLGLRESFRCGSATHQTNRLWCTNSANQLP